MCEASKRSDWDVVQLQVGGAEVVKDSGERLGLPRFDPGPSALFNIRPTPPAQTADVSGLLSCTCRFCPIRSFPLELSNWSCPFGIVSLLIPITVLPLAII